MSNAVELVEASWATLMEVVKDIPEERWGEPGVAGDWSIKDVLGHVAYWDGRAIGTVERSLTGEPEPDVSDASVDTINDSVHGDRAGWTVEQALAELHGTHDRLMAALRQHPTIDPDLIEDDTFEHYDEHAADIRAWHERVTSEDEPFITQRGTQHGHDKSSLSIRGRKPLPRLRQHG